MNTNRFLSGDIAKELDFYRMRENISSLAVSDEGKELLLKREAGFEKENIDYLKNLGRQWHTLLHSTKGFSFTSWPPVKSYFKTLGAEGSQLLQEEIYALGIFCNSAEKARESIFSASLEGNIPQLQNLVSSMPSLANPKTDIFSILDVSGEVKDLPALREIRNRIASLHKEIENAIRKYTSDSTLNNALQSNVPVFRADRQLLAVRADHRSSISGIIHEVSASGQTLYIEPDELVRANNELLQEEYNLECQLRLIFKELTAKLSLYKSDFEAAHNTMLLLDQTYAAAKWQKQINGIFADDIDSSLPCKIIQARHPLLGEKAVPVDISFLEGKRILIITGPNTGGKTVTLKTIALFALLNQAGFPIPAAEGTRLPIFSSIFADIGDEQSIDQSLSTFSAHMKRIGEMLTNADENSLILLDELGSGTDPQEGSAIAMSVLDELILRKSFVIVTTHHGILKNYGYTNPYCVNASVEFSTETLRPTYRLLMGIPGESHAIDIALNSGIPQNIITAARNYIATEQTDVSALIKGLTAKHAELDELKRQHQINEKNLEQKSLKVHAREIRLAEKEIELKEMEHSQSSAFLRQTRSDLENLVRKLREGEITREKTLGVKSFIEELQESVEAQTGKIDEAKNNLEAEKNLLNEEEEKFAANGMRISKSKEHKGKSSKKTKARISNSQALQNASASDLQNAAYEKQLKKEEKKQPVRKELMFQPGMEVYAGSARREGTLVRLVKDGLWSVQFGSMKMNVPQTQLQLKNINGQLPVAEVSYEKNTTYSSDEKPVFELRLLGMRYEEAMKAVEKQLDLCAIHNFVNFSIIHGKGNGILQQAVQDYLSNYPGVKEFHYANPEDGGFGKTYVTLRG